MRLHTVDDMWAIEVWRHFEFESFQRRQKCYLVNTQQDLIQIEDIIIIDGSSVSIVGGVAQLVERVLSMHEVRGSIPLSSILNFAASLS